MTLMDRKTKWYILVGLMGVLVAMCWVACGPSGTPIPTFTLPLEDAGVSESESKENQESRSTPHDKNVDVTQLPIPTPTSQVLADGSAQSIHVKFRPRIDVNDPIAAIPPELKEMIDSIEPLFTLTDAQMTEIGGGRLKLWFQLKLKPEANAEDFTVALQSLDIVETVELAPLPAPPP